MKKALLTRLLLSEIKAEKLPTPVLEHRFDPVRRWRFDFAWPDKLLAIEVHGAVFTGGRHTRGAGFEKDREKMNEAIVKGWRVLEYSTGQVKKGIPIVDLKRVFAAKAQTMVDMGRLK